MQTEVAREVLGIGRPEQDTVDISSRWNSHDIYGSISGTGRLKNLYAQ
jgi:hypothetical protein